MHTDDRASFSRPRYLSASVAAKRVGLSPWTLYRAIQAGHLRAFRPTGPAGRYRIREDDLQAWLERSQVGAGAL